MKSLFGLKRYLTLFLILLSGFAFAQTADEMDAMLTEHTVSAARAARFVLGAADLLPADVSGAMAETMAYDMAASKGWIKAGSGESVTMKSAAFLVMKAFDLKGGAFYSMFGSPRYAYREMVYRRIIMGRADQAMKVSGPWLLDVIDRTMKYAGVDWR